MQEELLVCKCVGSLTIWGNTYEEISENSFDPYVVSMSLGHHEEDPASKLPVIADKDVLRLLVSLKGFSKLDRNKSNSQFCLGKW